MRQLVNRPLDATCWRPCTVYVNRLYWACAVRIQYMECTALHYIYAACSAKAVSSTEILCCLLYWSSLSCYRSLCMQHLQCMLSVMHFSAFVKGCMHHAQHLTQLCQLGNDRAVYSKEKQVKWQNSHHTNLSTNTTKSNITTNRWQVKCTTAPTLKYHKTNKLSQQSGSANWTEGFV